MSFFKSKVMAAAVSGALMFGASQSMASPAFTVNPNAFEVQGFGISNFVADSISGTSSEMLILNPGDNTATGNGWVKFTSFNLASSGLSQFSTGLGNPLYNMYMTFSLKDTLVSGTLGGPNSVYKLDLLNIAVYYDKDANTSFQEAKASTNQFALVTGTTSDDKLLATGSLIQGQAGINSGALTGLGAFLNADVSFNLTPDGKSFFVSPDPFYSLSLAGFNNSGGGVELNGPLLSVSNAVGIMEFRVPEPESVALVGLGLLGLGASRRRSKKAD